jgi:hypothetical protein
MNPQLPDILRQRISSELQSVAAWPWHRRAMEQELAAHLFDACQEEFDREAAGALDRAIARLGHPDLWRRQLQATVSPFERITSSWLFSKDSTMSHRLTIILCVLGMIVWAAALPEDAPFMLGALSMLAVIGARHLLHAKYGPNWWSRGHFPWLGGCLAIAFGPAMILPALARIKAVSLQVGAVTFQYNTVAPLTIGALITMFGLGVLIWRVTRRIVRPA